MRQQKLQTRHQTAPRQKKSWRRTSSSSSHDSQDIPSIHVGARRYVLHNGDSKRCRRFSTHNNCSVKIRQDPKLQGLCCIVLYVDLLRGIALTRYQLQGNTPSALNYQLGLPRVQPGPHREVVTPTKALLTETVAGQVIKTRRPPPLKRTVPRRLTFPLVQLFKINTTGACRGNIPELVQLPSLENCY